MKTKTKTCIIIISTLLIGILLGTFIDRTLMRQQFRRKVVGMRGPEGFIRVMNHIIRPDDTQREMLEKIYDKRSKQIHEIGESSRKQIEAIMDSLRNEIEPILTDVQKERLEQRIERLKDWRGHHPPRRRSDHRGPVKSPPPPPLD